MSMTIISCENPHTVMKCDVMDNEIGRIYL